MGKAGTSLAVTWETTNLAERGQFFHWTVRYLNRGNNKIEIE
jgi:hypothetical protein